MSSSDKLPPHSIEAEQGVLGCVLLASDCMDQCLAVPQFMAMFYDLRHQTVFDAMQAVYEDRHSLDLILLMDKLRDMGELDRVGGYAFLSSLPDKTPAPSQIGYYIDILKSKYVLRNTIRSAMRIADMAMKFDGDNVSELVDRAERDMLGAASALYEEREVTIKDLVLEASDELEALMRGDARAIKGAACGLREIDRMLDGLMHGKMVVIGGLPGQGKTSLAMTMAAHLAIEERIPVGVFSQEMTARELTMRSLCALATVDVRAIKGGAHDRTVDRLTLSAGRLAASPLYICEESSLSVMQFKARARRMIQRHSVRVFFIDYLQLMESDSRSDNRQTAIAEISRALKVFAGETQTTVVVLVQLNRELEKAKRKPILADIRESGAVAQDADAVLLLYQPDDLEPENMNIVVAKNRSGPMGDVPVVFMRGYTRFESAAETVQDSVEEQTPPRRNMPYKDD